MYIISWVYCTVCNINMKHEKIEHTGEKLDLHTKFMLHMYDMLHVPQL